MQKHVKLARILHQKLAEKSGGPAPLMHNGHICCYNASRGVYEALEEKAVQRLIMEYDGARFQGERMRGWLSNSDCKGVFERLVMLTEDGAVQPKRGVAFLDAFITIDDGVITAHEHSPAHGALFGLSIPWSVDPARGFWHEILRNVWGGDLEEQEKAAVLAEFVGACLFGVATAYKKAVFLYGHRGNNGKSTIIDGVRGLFDDPPVVEPHLIGNERVATRLALARINTVPEMPQDEFPAPEAIKAAIAGDPMRARFLYRQDFEFSPVCGHLVAGNNLPTCKDPSNAFWSRWILMECPNEIPPEKRIPLLEMKERLHACRQEIAAWAVAGAARLFARNRYPDLASSSAALRVWRRKSDQLAQFLDEYTVEGGGVDLLVLYARYRGWCSDAGHRQMSRSTFEERLRQKGIELTAIALKGTERVE